MSEYTLGLSIVGCWLAGSIAVLLWVTRYLQPARILLVVAAIFFAVAALSGCATTKSVPASSCVLTTPPPFFGDPNEATDDDVAAMAAWTREAWSRCAAVGAHAPYPAQSIADGL